MDSKEATTDFTTNSNQDRVDSHNANNYNTSSYYKQNTPLNLPASHLLHSTYHTATQRKWLKNLPEVSQLIYPVFVYDTPDDVVEIASMPGIKNYGQQKIADSIAPLVEKGLESVLIFGVLRSSEDKDAQGTYAGGLGREGPTEKGIKALRKRFPQLFIVADVCLCAFTSHGHCGILKEDDTIDNAKSARRLAQVALSYVEAGANMVAPSDMMDGRIGEIKKLLIERGLEVPVMSYAAKFASCLYGPFRDVCKSAPSKFDRQSYQLPIDSSYLALKAVERDLAEGADYVMVKPIGPYLDIVKEIRDKFNPIIACYHVSGEYSTIVRAAEAGIYDKKKAVLEWVRSFKRAGVDIIITYFAPELLDWLREERM